MKNKKERKKERKKEIYGMMENEGKEEGIMWNGKEIRGKGKRKRKKKKQ